MKMKATCATKGGVGKTTLIANLGVIKVSSGCRVLLVDAATHSPHFLVSTSLSKVRERPDLLNF